MALLAPPAGATPAAALSWLLFTGSSVHVAATGWLFTVPAVRDYARAHALRCLWVPAALIVAGAVAAATFSPAAFQWLLLPYFCWQFFHYQKQNVGMAALAASAHRVRPLARAERIPLLVCGFAAIGALIARPGLVGLHVLGSQPLRGVIGAACAVTFTVAVGAGLAGLARRPAAERPASFCATYLVCLLFSLPVFAFSSPYAAIGGMTVAHGLQYLLLVGLIAGAGQDRRPDQPSRLVRLAMLGNVALIGGAALSTASHLHDAAPAGRLLFGAYLGVVMSHFVIDAGLWRMRDPLARRFVAGQLPFLVPQRP